MCTRFCLINWGCSSSESTSQGIELGENHRAGRGIKSQDGELVNRPKRFRPEDFVRRPGGGDGAVVEKNQLISEGRAEVDVVRGENYRELLFAGELAEKF